MNITTYLDEHQNKSLLRFLTCGSVDDGKSTLIGHLLYDSKLIFDDQLNALRQASEKNGTTGVGQIDYALLLDGLKAEREQGITIDVAYRYFTTPKRKFIVVDCPGHEQYTRNMATGASTADLAIILIDARHGVLTQTKRHAYIVSLLGIRHIVVAVNKMDLFHYDQNVFLKIQEEFAVFAEGLNLPDISYIPLSALTGENVVKKSDKMPWYKGESLLNILENVDISQDVNLTDFRYPVQYVCRPDLNFRGFAGSVVSGSIRVGETIRVLPGGRQSRVKRIVTADGDLEEAFPPLPVTLELEDEIDISCGDMLVKPDNLPFLSREFEAQVIWMTETPLAEGKRYLLRHAGRNVPARVARLSHEVDVNTLKRTPANELRLNHVGRVAMETTQPLFFDKYEKNHATGSFILIDPISNATAGAGMIVHNLEGKQDDKSILQAEEELDPTAPLVLDKGLLSDLERFQNLGQQGKAILVSGQDALRVNEVSSKLEKVLASKRLKTYYVGLARGAQRHAVSEQRLTQLAALAYTMSEAGIVAVAALPKFPALLNFAYWAPFAGDKIPLLVWLGDTSSAPGKAQIILADNDGLDAKIDHIATLLADSYLWNQSPDYQI